MLVELLLGARVFAFLDQVFEPIGAALLLMLFLPRPQAQGGSTQLLSYLTIVRTGSVLLPNSAIAVVGLMRGFTLSFMALYLNTVKVPTSVFSSRGHTVNGRLALYSHGVART